MKKILLVGWYGLGVLCALPAFIFLIVSHKIGIKYEFPNKSI